MIKRIFDISVSLIGLIIFFPILLMAALMIYFIIGRPILFVQPRPGKEGKPFQIVKFRTMLDAYDRNGEPLSDSERLTHFGKFIRSLSIDELPELWNVLKGDMSLVGPRPLLMEYVPLYNQDQFRRHEARPGITGWAQVNGRNSTSWEERFKQDVWYIDNQTFWLDLKILFLTIKKVFIREGISAEGEATMPKFKGTSSRGIK